MENPNERPFCTKEAIDETTDIKRPSEMPQFSESYRINLTNENTPIKNETEGSVHNTVEKKDEERLRSVRDKLGLLQKGLHTVRDWWTELKEGQNTKTNIEYYDKHMYRCIGKGGYEDFIKTGSIHSKNKAKYWDVSFNIGEPAEAYIQGDSGSYILEVSPEAGDFRFKTNPYSLSGSEMKNIPYRSIQPGIITEKSPIRIYKRVDLRQGIHIYDVVYDNIGGKALKNT